MVNPMDKNLTIQDAKRLLATAKTVEDVGKLFDMFFGEKNVFNDTQNLLRYDFYSQIVQKYSNGDKLSAIELADLAYLIKTDYSSDMQRYITQEFPIFSNILNTAMHIQPEDIAEAMKSDGIKFVSELGLDHIITKMNIDDAWKTIAQLWGSYTVEGLKSITKEGEWDEYYDDKVKLSEYVIANIKSDLSENDKKLIELFITGKIAGWTPNDKKERLLLCEIIELRDKGLFEIEDFSENFKKLRKQYRIFNVEDKQQIQNYFNKVTQAIKDASGITQEEADSWAAKNVYIEEATLKSLNSIGYTEETLRKDIAEYYQYCGGKLGPIQFVGTARNQRAFARGRNIISIDCDFNKWSLFHECSHLVEDYDITTLHASQAFIHGRAKGKSRSLNSIMGYGRSKIYKSDEKAYPDNFIHAYVGKIYDRASEVYSMGMQMFADPETLAWFIENDMEHFSLIIGQCLHKNEFMKRQLQKSNEQAAKKMDEFSALKERKDQWEKELKKAIPANLKEALSSSEGIDGCSFTASGKISGKLYLYNQTLDRWEDIWGKTKDLIKIAYLYLVSRQSLLPDEPYGDKDNVNIDNIRNDIFSGDNPPSWFNANLGLPKYVLHDSIKDKLKEIKKAEKQSVENKIKFFNIIDNKIPHKLMSQLMENKGYAGYSVMATFSGVYTLYSKHAQKVGNSGYVGEFSREECLRCAYLLIMNDRKALPDVWDDPIQAMKIASKYARGTSLPSWESTSLPELEL